jgi:hypothetical protein
MVSRSCSATNVKDYVVYDFTMNKDPELTPTAAYAQQFERYASDQRPLSPRLTALVKKLEQQTGFEGENYRRFLAIEIDDYAENEIRLRRTTTTHAPARAGSGGGRMRFIQQLPESHYGETKTVSWFAIMPVTIGTETRWLERVTVEYSRFDGWGCFAAPGWLAERFLP